MNYNIWQQPAPERAPDGGEKMGTVNPVVLYYDILLILSVILTGIYVFFLA